MCGSVKQCNYTECEIQEFLIHGTIVFYFNTWLFDIDTVCAYKRSVYEMFLCLHYEHCVTHSGNIANKKTQQTNNCCANIFSALPELAGHVFL